VDRRSIHALKRVLRSIRVVLQIVSFWMQTPGFVERIEKPALQGERCSIRVDQRSIHTLKRVLQSVQLVLQIVGFSLHTLGRVQWIEPVVRA
jgi:hypothetical protein